MMTPPPPNPPCIPITYLTRSDDLVCGWRRVSCCVGLLLCGCFRSASCVTLGIAPLKQWPFVDMISCSSIHFVLFDHHYYLLLIVSVFFYFFFSFWFSSHILFLMADANAIYLSPKSYYLLLINTFRIT